MGRSLSLFDKLLVRASEGATLVRRPGLIATVCPAAPDRSLFNGVTYADPQALAGALEDLARTYDAAGVEAWTVWAPESDRGTAQLLESAGHKLDATPRAMGMELSDLAAPDPGDLDWTTDGSFAELSRLNDEAYGYAPGNFERALGQFPRDEANLYLARLDDAPASTLFTVDRDGDCGIYFVATSPAAQRRGLSRRLLHLALAEALERGCETTTLQATKAGRPVYERLGYRDLGGLEMWERRK
jgi:GNAT superfamily N-acetyltransferase